jgi:hypothetical protein
MCDILFIHSPVGRHLGCFHILAVVMNAAMNIDVQIPVWDHAFNSFDVHMEVKLLDHMKSINF